MDWIVSRLERLSQNSRRFNLLLTLILIVVGVAIYWPAIRAPWYGDDLFGIVNHPRIAQLDYWLTAYISNRWLTNLTFGINFQLNGIEPAGYRIFNIALHIVTALLVFILLKTIWRSNKEQWLAIIGSLLFLLHPLQTQSVTYIVQRSALLAGLFTFLTLIFWQRTFINSRVQTPYLILTLLSSLLAVFSKGNAAVIPALVFIYDYYLLENGAPKFKDYLRRRGRYLLLLSLGPLLLFGNTIADDTLAGFFPQLADNVGSGVAPSKADIRVLFFERSNETPGLLLGNLEPESRSIRYLATEAVVLWKYIQLTLFPFNQHLDYCYPLIDSPFNLKVILATLSGCALLWYIIVKLKNGIVTAGALWFITALIVESSLIPLDPLFEHRLYTPLFGLIIIALKAIQKIGSYSKSLLLTLPVVVIFSLLTVERNQLWSEPEKFWRSNAMLTPGCYRPQAHLGELLIKKNKYREAIYHLNKSLELKTPVPAESYANLGVAYLKLGELSAARNNFESSLRVNDKSAVVHSNLGTLLFELKDEAAGLNHLRRAVELEPESTANQLNLAQGLLQLNRLSESSTLYQALLKREPNRPEALLGLGQIYHRQGDNGVALGYLEQAWRAAGSENLYYAYQLALTGIKSGQVERVKAATDIIKRSNRRLYLQLQQESGEILK